MSRVAWSCMVVALWCWPTLAQPREVASPQVTKAQIFEAIQAGRYGIAVGALEALFESHPRERSIAYLRYQYARCLLFVGRPREALREGEAAAQIAGANGEDEVAELANRISTRSAHVLAAIEAIDGADARVEPADVMVHLGGPEAGRLDILKALARFHLRRAAYVEAAESWNHVAGLADALGLPEVAEAARGEADQARAADLKRTLSTLEGEPASARLRWEGAIERYPRLIKLARVRLLGAHQLFEAGRFAEALDELDALLEDLAPGNPVRLDVAVGRASVLEGLARYREAYTQWDTVYSMAVTEGNASVRAAAQGARNGLLATQLGWVEVRCVDRWWRDWPRVDGQVPEAQMRVGFGDGTIGGPCGGPKHLLPAGSSAVEVTGELGETRGTVTVAKGKTVPIGVEPPRSFDVAPWVLAGLGAAALGTSGYFYSRAYTQYQIAADADTGQADYEDEKAHYESLRAATFATAAAGLVLTGFAGVLWASETAGPQLIITPFGAAAGSRF